MISLADAYRKSCYVLLRHLNLSSPAPIDATSHVQHSGPGRSLPPTTDGGKHEFSSRNLSYDHFDTLFPSVEDYPWLRLSLCRIECKQQILEQLPHLSFLLLQDVQAENLTCRESHLNVQDSQMLWYASVLVTSLQFDFAVGYLCEHANEHWVHYAIQLELLLYIHRFRDWRRTDGAHAWTLLWRKAVL